MTYLRILLAALTLGALSLQAGQVQAKIEKEMAGFRRALNGVRA